jgi:hypothetical protein
MPRDLILHIGTSKTGSTSIQRVLSRQRAELARQGVYYPASPGRESHVLLTMAATANRHLYGSPDRPIWSGIGPDARLARFRDEFASEMAAIPAHCRKIVVSAEQFSMLLRDRQSLQNLHDLLRPHADSINVVVYLRRQDQHFASLFSEMLRWGDAQYPDLLTMRPYAQHGYNYATLLSRWVSAFGRRFIKPRVFAPTAGQRFDVVEDFLQVCGASLDLTALSAARVANSSISLAGQMLLVALAARIRARNPSLACNVQSPLWRKLATAVSAALPGPGWRPTQDEARAFLERYRIINDAVRERWFPERQALFDTDFSALPVDPVALDETAMFDAAARLMPALGHVISPAASTLPQRAAGLDATLDAILDQAGAAARQHDRVAVAVARQAQMAGDRQRQRTALATRLQIDPANAAARLELAALYLQDGDRRAAAYCVERVLRGDAGHPGALALQGRLAAAEDDDGTDAGEPWEDHE